MRSFESAAVLLPPLRFDVGEERGAEDDDVAGGDSEDICTMARAKSEDMLPVEVDGVVLNSTPPFAQLEEEVSMPPRT